MNNEISKESSRSWFCVLNNPSNLFGEDKTPDEMVEEAIEKHAEVKGELVIIIQRKAETETTINEAEIRQRIEEYLQQGMRTKELTKQLVLEMGIAKNYAYEMILKISKKTR